MTVEQSDELEALLRGLPPDIAQRVRALEGLEGLLEIVMDLGRLPEARFARREETLPRREGSAEDLAYVISHIGQFGGDNRAGIERTLHRISALRNRAGKVVGLTLRVGRAVYGTMEIIRDVVEAGRSILLLGRPGVGKTTLLREVARVLAEMGKRVVIVDTSNEIAGDGDIPHPGIGRARHPEERARAQGAADVPGAGRDPGLPARRALPRRRADCGRGPSRHAGRARDPRARGSGRDRGPHLDAQPGRLRGGRAAQHAARRRERRARDDEGLPLWTLVEPYRGGRARARPARRDPARARGGPRRDHTQQL